MSPPVRDVLSCQRWAIRSGSATPLVDAARHPASHPLEDTGIETTVEQAHDDGRANGDAAWFLTAWDLLYLGLIAVGTTRAFLSDQPPGHSWLVAGFAVASALWYATRLAAMSTRAPGERRLVWLAGVVATAVVLSLLSADFAWLAFPVAFQVAYRMEVAPAVAGSVVVAVAAMLGLAWPEGELTLAEVVGPTVGVAMATVVAIGYRTLLAQRAHTRRLNEQLTATRDQLAEVARNAGIAEERARLSREIHDTLAQELASSVLGVQAASRDLPDSSSARDRLEQVERQLRSGLDEARRFVDELAPPALDDTPLTEALGRLCTEHARQGPAEVTFEVSGQPQESSTRHEVVLYRIAREALANAATHADATAIRVTLTHLEDATLLDVVDDGRGFDPDEPSPGHGLRGIADRLREVGGTLDLESAPDRGTALGATVPSERQVTRR